jgi:exopolysaccharide biosynthesis protein
MSKNGEHIAHRGVDKGGRPHRDSLEDIDKYADEFLNWLNNENNIWFKDFCLNQNIDPDYLSEWAERSERFRGVYKLAKHRQESRLINGGLFNKMSGNIVKLVLSNAHGWSDKQETKVSGDKENPLAFLLDMADGKSKELCEDES